MLAQQYEVFATDEIDESYRHSIRDLITDADKHIQFYDLEALCDEHIERAVQMEAPSWLAYEQLLHIHVDATCEQSITIHNGAVTVLLVQRLR